VYIYYRKELPYWTINSRFYSVFIEVYKHLPPPRRREASLPLFCAQKSRTGGNATRSASVDQWSF
jgi:hypothetical protein